MRLIHGKNRILNQENYFHNERVLLYILFTNRSNYKIQYNMYYRNMWCKKACNTICGTVLNLFINSYI